MRSVRAKYVSLVDVYFHRRTIFISNMKLAREFDVNIMLHPARVERLNFGTKPLSHRDYLSLFFWKVTFYGLSCSCPWNSSYLHTAADRRGAQRYSFPDERCGKRAESDFAIKREFFRGIYILAFDAYPSRRCIRIFPHLFANRKLFRVFTPLFPRKVSQALS